MPQPLAIVQSSPPSSPAILTANYLLNLKDWLVDSENSRNTMTADKLGLGNPRLRLVASDVGGIRVREAGSVC